MSYRRNDFHGGRAYAPEPSDKPRFGFHASLMIAWVKLQLRQLTSAASPSIARGSSRRKDDGQSRELDTRAFPNRREMPPRPLDL